MKRSRRPFISVVYDERAAGGGASHPIGSVSSEQAAFACDLCGDECTGSPTGSGLFLWHRGDELRIEEPPLCEQCTSRVTMGAVSKWAIEGDEEG